MAEFCSIKIEKIKSTSALHGLYVHCETIEGRSQAPNVDQEEGLFLNLLPESIDYTERFLERISQASCQHNKKIFIRQNSVLAYSMVFSVPYTLKDEVQLSKWCEDVKQFLNNQFGENNVIGLSLHTDEITPHIHAVITPITNDGRLCAKDFFGGKYGRNKLSKFHTAYYKEVGKQHGFRRATRGRKTNAKDIKAFYSSLNKTLSEKLPEIEPDESIEEYMNRCNDTFKLANLQAKKAKKDLEDEKKSTFALRQEYYYGMSLQDRLFSLFDEDEGKTFLQKLLKLSNQELEKLVYSIINKPDKTQTANDFDNAKENKSQCQTITKA